MGGQVGDTGKLSGSGLSVHVTDTKHRDGGLESHIGVVEEGTISSKLPCPPVSYTGTI